MDNAARWFYVGIGSFAAGVFLRSFADFGLSFPLFILLLGAVLGAYIFLAHKSQTLLFIPLVCVAAGLGILRFDLADAFAPRHVLDAYLDMKVTLEGVVVDEPVHKERTQQLRVRVESIENSAVGEEEVKILLLVETRPEYGYGDRLHISGVLKEPEPFETDNGRLFDYPAYLAKDGIFYQMLYPAVEFVDGGHGNPVKRLLFGFKEAFLSRVERVVPEPHAALLGGLVVGAQESLGDELLEDLRDVGIIHIVVLSGYNVTIVAEAIMRFTGVFLPRLAAIGLGALGIVLFAVMTGGSATIVRASIMALLVVLARATGRTYDITRALFVAGFVMIALNPTILVFDPSFQLSFLATLGLVYVAPIIEKHLHFVSTKWQLREVVVATIATQIFVLPLLLFQIGELSLVALPVNVLILAAVPVTMFLGFLTGIVGFAGTVLSLPFAYASYGFLAYMLGVVSLFSTIPFASLALPVFPAWGMFLLYGGYVVFLTYVHRKKNTTPANLNAFASVKGGGGRCF
jgi:competence protein ComEC